MSRRYPVSIPSGGAFTQINRSGNGRRSYRHYFIYYHYEVEANKTKKRSPSDAIPHPITEDVANGQAVNLVEDTSPTTSTTAGSTTTPTTKQSTAQKKKKSKRNRGTGQANRAAGSYTYSPVVLTRYYNPNWELEYQMSGPDHTQCSRDCDWCGICAIREPY